MKFLKVKILKYVSHDQPGFILCSFVDANGKEWSMTEKVPVLTSKGFPEEFLPIEGFYIAGEVVSEDKDIVIFDTSNPWSISADKGETLFKVLKNQISDVSSDD